jgi:hypothetical protein
MAAGTLGQEMVSREGGVVVALSIALTSIPAGKRPGVRFLESPTTKTPGIAAGGLQVYRTGSGDQ